MLSQLSICILTYQRQYILAEVIRYHMETNARVIILDASPKKWCIPHDISAHQNVTYLHFPSASHLERYLKLLDIVKTPFCVFRSDRRHQSNYALQCCVEFLKHNEDYTSARGGWLSGESQKPCYCTEYFTRFGEIQDVSSRVKFQMLAYDATYYDVYRTKVIFDIINIYDKIYTHVENIYFLEIIQAICASISGKSKFLSVLQGITQDLPVADSYYRSYPDALYLFDDKKIIDICATAFSDVLHFSPILPVTIYELTSFALKKHYQWRCLHDLPPTKENLLRVLSFFSTTQEEKTISHNEDIISAAALFFFCNLRNPHINPHFLGVDITEQNELLALVARCEDNIRKYLFKKMSLREKMGIYYHKFPSLIGHCFSR